ncbi:glycosyltransferase family 2 protein [Cerasicoccus frondis]|uniref:glycosyltransferase family 2 protein n=1 Tax=Cerasicoccus frondis TaxID=490090 RepID=UPI002852A6E3|nr:glycosyltransferase family 2 protein [Cerasicoccus frondis]
MAKRVTLSVGIALYNEEASIDALLEQLTQVLAELEPDFEIILVDDGSRDQTFAKIQAAHEADPRIVAVSLSRNYGQQVAFTAAMELSRGDALVLMDGDLQDEPSVIRQFVEHWRAGYDVVYAVRERRIASPWLRLAYFAYYRIFSSISNTRVPLDSGDFSLMSRRVVDALNAMPEQQRYLRGLRAWVGYKQKALPVTRPERAQGETKYTLRKLVRLALDGIFSFTVAPLRGAMLLGLAILTPTVCYAAYTLIAFLFFNSSPRGFTAMINAIILFAGVQLVFLGVIGEYIGRIYMEVKQRPCYLIDKILRDP